MEGDNGRNDGNGQEELTVYDRDYFLNSTEPFEKIYSIRDPFERAQELIKMTAIAKASKVSGFADLYKNYCKAVELAGGNSAEPNETAFTGQPAKLLTGRWTADDKGIYRIGENGQEELACWHPIMPVERYTNLDTGLEKVKIAYAKSGHWRTQIFDRSVLANKRTIVRLADYGIGVTSENAKNLVQYLYDVEALNYGAIDSLKSVTRLGWVKGGMFSPYAEGVTFDGDINFKNFYESVTTSGDADKWIEHVRQIRAENRIPTRMVLASAFASALVDPCGSLPFMVHVWNGSANGKTVSLMMAASVWADPSEYIHTFNSTDVAQELSAGFVNSLPLILDELQIQKGRREGFDKMVYKLCEGIGKSRGAKGGGLQRTTRWRNCILTTGEDPITSSSSGSGTVNRIIEINTEGTNFFSNAKKSADFFRDNYGHAGRMFVEALMEDGNIQLAKDMQRNFFDLLLGRDITEKQIMAASLILTADALSEMFVFRDGKELTVDEVATFLSTNDEVSADQRAYDWLHDWLAQNKRKFDPENDKVETWGKVEQGSVYIVRDVFNRACTDNGFNPSSFLSWMRRHDLIETEGKGYTKRIRMNGMKCQAVVLKSEDIPEGFEPVPEGEQVKF